MEEFADYNNSGVYKITNTINGKIYIGSAKNIKTRKKTHLNRLRKGNHDNTHLQNAFSLYGEKYFVFDVIEYCEAKDLLLREQFYIDELNPEYNIRKIAKSNYGLKHSEKTIDKMREVKIGNTYGFKKGNIPKNIKYGKDNYFYGIKKFGKENPFYEKTHSEESKNKIRDKNKGKSKNVGENNPNSTISNKIVEDIKKEKILSTRDISIKYNVSESSVRRIKSGVRRKNG